MKKRHIKLLLKLEKILEKELDEMYTESIIELFPMFDNQNIPFPSRQKVVHKIEKKMREQHAELASSKIISSIIGRFVSKKYEVIKR